MTNQLYPQNMIQGDDTMRHGIRMDLYVDKGGSCLYDFEPDKYTDKKLLPKTFLLFCLFS
jgi:hypothetical protein